MKRYIHTSLLMAVMTCSFGLKAQEWFPVGASWYYNQVILLQGETYVHFEVIGDTIIQGKNCKIISGSCNCVVPGVGSIVYQEGDKIYSYNSEPDTFRLLYDFTLEPGDTLIFEGDPDVGGDGYYLIDSITTIQVGSQTLRVQHITHLAFDVVWGDIIIERIGSNGCLYPVIGFCDPSTGGLRCYEDAETGLINFQTPPRSCTYVTGIDDPLAVPDVKIFPNPATYILNIQSENPIEQITLFNNLGIPVLRNAFDGQTAFDLEVYLMPPGMYYVHIVLTDHQVVRRSVIIQK